MKISFKSEGEAFVFSVDDSLVGNKGVGQGGAEVTLVNSEFRVHMPRAVSVPHPDLVALACVAAFHPWIKGEVEFPFAVSRSFAEVLSQNFKIVALNVDLKLVQRQKADRHAISFSGGADSAAAYALMRSVDPVKITYIREDHPSAPVRQDNTKETVEKAVNAFEGVVKVRSDLEYIVGPYLQFPTWVALSIPCILLADAYNLRSMAYGSIDVASMVSGGHKYVYRPEPDRQWRALLGSAGISINKPVAGLSEVSTALIVRENGLADIATSCTLGEFQRPCMQCSKCFRKYLITCAVDRVQPSNEILERFLHSKQLVNFLQSDYPVHCHHTMMYVFSTFDIASMPKVYRLFNEKLFLEPVDVSWAARHDVRATEAYVPDDNLRNLVVEETHRYIEPVTDEDKVVMYSWDLSQVKARNLKRLETIQRDIAHEVEYVLAGASRDNSTKSRRKRSQVEIKARILVKKLLGIGGR